MGWWQVDADTLAGSRFVVSPLAETTASLLSLERGVPAHPGERSWLDAHRPAYQERLAADPVTALLVRSALGRTYLADFLTPPPADGSRTTFEEELARVRRAPPGTARTDLAVALGGPLPRRLHRSDLPERAADLLEWVWTRAVEPVWARRRRILEADVVARTRQLSQGGWSGVLDDMREGMDWLGEGRFRINPHDSPPREISGARLSFVPVTLCRGWVCWEPPRRYAVVYPCSGALAEPARPHTSGPGALARLLGPARATVLGFLDTPKSTTQLVALTGQGLGSVGRHLKVLLDAGLAQRRRAGRSVLYYRTALGEALLLGRRDGS